MIAGNGELAIYLDDPEEGRSMNCGVMYYKSKFIIKWTYDVYMYVVVVSSTFQPSILFVTVLLFSSPMIAANEIKS